MKQYVFLLLTFLMIGSTVHAQEVPFVEKTMLALRKKDHSGDVPLQLKQHYSWYKRDMATCESQEYYPEFTQSITDLAIENDIYYQVDVKTPKQGALVRYQTVFERVNKKNANEFATLTNHCKSKLPPGYYFFWCERNGKTTSDWTRKIYIFENTSVDLVEKE